MYLNTRGRVYLTYYMSVQMIQRTRTFVRVTLNTRLLYFVTHAYERIHNLIRIVFKRWLPISNIFFSLLFRFSFVEIFS